MRIVVVGSSGTIGRAVAAAFEGHDVIGVHRNGTVQADIADPESIERMFAQVGPFDALVSAAGAARFKPFAELSDEDYRFSIANKLMGR